MSLEKLLKILRNVFDFSSPEERENSRFGVHHLNREMDAYISIIKHDNLDAELIKIYEEIIYDFVFEHFPRDVQNIKKYLDSQTIEELENKKQELLKIYYQKICPRRRLKVVA